MSAVTTCLLFILPVLVWSASEIQFPFGRVQGYDKPAYSTQKPYIVYYGIPYAKPPVGDLRFRPPEPYVGNGTDTIISSDSFRPACMQLNLPNGTAMSEDCLHLNIFTPPDKSTTRKVMFWIHGGGFEVGDALLYVPSQMVTDNDVIVVTIQYRLGVFGFLSTGNGDGNNGLRDQILALKWVKDNIRQFGGDPDDITIFGESAGAASVSFLSISPLAKGLFTKAILQSGTALSTWAMNRKPLAKFNAAADKLGCTDPMFHYTFFSLIRGTEKMNCLRNKTQEELLSLNIRPLTPDTNADKTWSPRRNGWRGREKGRKSTSGGNGFSMLDTNDMFLPIVDGEVIPRSPDSLISDPAYLQQVGALDRKYVIGFNNNEGLVIFGYIMASGGVANFTTGESADTFIRQVAELMFPNSKPTENMLDLLKYEYTYPRTAGRTALQGLIDVTSDALFTISSIQFARGLTQASNLTDVYMYLFDHEPQLLVPHGLLKGSIHGMELSYEFDDDHVIKPYSFYANAPQASEGSLRSLFTGVLTQFSKTGNPSNPSGQSLTWPRYDSSQENFLKISMTPEVDQHVYAKRAALWIDFLFKKAKSSCDISKRWRF